MKSLVCFAILAVMVVVQCARVPDQDEHGVARIRRSNPWDFFNKVTKKKTTKKVVKKKPKSKPKPNTQATTTLPPVTTTTTTTTIPSVASDKNKMPDYIAKKMGKLKSEDQVKRFLGITASMSQKIDALKRSLPTLTPPRASGQNSGASSDDNSKWTTSPGCMPRPQPISFHQPNLYHGFLYPPCAMALRCGGCCLVNLHRCVPDQVKTVNHPAHYVVYNMISSQRNSRKKRSSGVQFRWIPVENHLSCKCQCKVRPEDCDPKRQYHDESTCQCKCRDGFISSTLNCTEPFRYDMETCSCKCAYHDQHCPVAKQHWDNKQCRCTCDSGIRCPMGQAINQNSCECEDIQMSDKRCH